MRIEASTEPRFTVARSKILEPTFCRSTRSPALILTITMPVIAPKVFSLQINDSNCPHKRRIFVTLPPTIAIFFLKKSCRINADPSQYPDPKERHRLCALEAHRMGGYCYATGREKEEEWSKAEAERHTSRGHEAKARGSCAAGKTFGVESD